MNENCVQKLLSNDQRKLRKVYENKKKSKWLNIGKEKKKTIYCLRVCEQCEIKLMMIEQEIYQFDFHSLCIIFYDEGKTISGFFNFPIQIQIFFFVCLKSDPKKFIFNPKNPNLSVVNSMKNV